ncbi:hypothetical protein [Vibrio fortis]|uniref:hypothetical protein n=1 Tax=Vibrio fortis TaxID=212667 RepID=UPI001CD97BAF|nr:hypothetical protein [Vibrio fortis]
MHEFVLDDIVNSVPANEDVYLDEKVISVLDNFKYFLYKQTAKTFENCEMKSYLSLLESHVPGKVKSGSVLKLYPITKVTSTCWNMLLVC